MQRPIHQIVTVIAILVLIWVCQSCSKDDHSPRILIFNKTEFVFHESTAAGTAALEKLCQENNYRVDITEEGEYFTQENLQQYAAIIFLNTAGDVLNYKQEAEFERYIQAGGSFVGLHTAVDTEHNWKWFGNLVGAMFDGQSSEQKASLVVQDDQHPTTQNLEPNWSRRDEWLNLKNISSEVNVLLTVDENSYPGGTMGAFHPVSWYHDYDGGRSFVTTMGHSKSSYEDPVFLQHLLGALKYAIGNNQPLDYTKPRAATAPAATTGGTGFVKTSVVCDLYEPMEFAMFPDGKILFIERRGALKVYDPGTGATKVVDELAVFIEHEEGLLGLSLDPNWAKNHWIYLFYTPEDDDEAIRLSRFEFFNDALVRSSEKILLKIPTLRDPRHYHAAGSIEFDDQGFLYLAMGDNSAHRDGYSSLDERPEEQAFDSQKASSNSMDLRGKILRIKPLPDGSYLCPAGNMYTTQAQVASFEAQPFLNDPLLKDFVQQRLNTLALENGSLPPGTFDTDSTAARAFPFLTNAKVGAGLPEIFVMGVRNPYRISFDSRRRTLYWGEPGPDAGVADPNWGPEGYDEVNAARTAGFYGWPYFVGPNKAYRDYDHFTDTPGEYFDPLHPVNFSLNNTGTPYLPATRKPLIWYPFSSSTEFPLLANGTRCAMAGPTYYCDQYPAETRFPDEFNGKLIIYDWMRNWIRAVTLDSLGNYVSMDPLADNLRVSRPIDMIIDKKGSLWVLEYGTEWYSTNPDACLSRIDFVRGDGKSAPIAETEAKSPVRWDLGNKNRSFYKPGDVLPYKVVVTDPASVDPAALHLAIEYKETEQNAFAFAKTYRPAVPKNEFARGQTLL
ncbi:MAG: ThuA domain-containing protein, partial [Saprospiraceae bacterium]|nr:ThuA domain-containing protein [Saprospiraceae bacterium]